MIALTLAVPSTACRRGSARAHDALAGQWKLVSLHFNVDDGMPMDLTDHRITLAVGKPHASIHDYEWIDGDDRGFRLKVLDPPHPPAIYEGRFEGEHLMLRTPFEPSEMRFERIAR